MQIQVIVEDDFGGVGCHVASEVAISVEFIGGISGSHLR